MLEPNWQNKVTRAKQEPTNAKQGYKDQTIMEQEPPSAGAAVAAPTAPTPAAILVLMA